jgi:signal peptidase
MQAAPLSAQQIQYEAYSCAPGVDEQGWPSVAHQDLNPESQAAPDPMIQPISAFQRGSDVYAQDDPGIDAWQRQEPPRQFQPQRPHEREHGYQAHSVSELNRQFISNPKAQPPYGLVAPKEKASAPTAKIPAKTAQSPKKKTPSNAKSRQKPVKGKKSGKPKTIWTRISDFLFYTALLSMVIAAVYYSSASSGAPVDLMGYSMMTVLTPSMQSVYPQGSLVFTRKVDASELQVGEDITYMKEATTSVTHRIAEIIENYENSGERGFRTFGVENTAPDPTIVPAIHVIGRVFFCIPKLGMIVTFIANNILLLLVMFALMILLSFLIRGLLKQDPPDSKSRANAKNAEKAKVKPHKRPQRKAG